ncbi:MAG: type II toxin-antitoxin system VapC family toxin [Alistipes sp.]|nr:type II toxin-antitoxin system VapC family toxin [Alistipes sp.]
MIKVIFDSNVFDDIVAGKIDMDILTRNGVEVYITHLQVDEINECPDAEKRARLFNSMTELRPYKVPTESFCVGISRIGSAKINDGSGLIQKLEAGNSNNAHDALIGETAIKNGLTLITNDKKFKNRVAELGGMALTTEELLTRMNI